MLLVSRYGLVEENAVEVFHYHGFHLSSSCLEVVLTSTRSSALREGPLALSRGTILIPGYIRPPPTLAVYDVAQSLPLGGAGRDFPFTEDET